MRFYQQPEIFLIIMALASLPSSPAAATWPAHYLVFEVGDTGVPEPVFYRLVEMAAELPPPSDVEMSAARRRLAVGEPLVIAELLADDGAEVHRQIVELPRWIRGEFPDGPGSGAIDSHRVVPRRRAFVLRLPAVDGGQLVVEHSGRFAYSMADLAERADDLRLAPMAWKKDRLVAVRRADGNPANRMDLLVVSEGYTAAEQAIFNADVADFEAGFFTVSPYSEYRNFVNETSLFVASPESGADHPPFDSTCPLGNSNTCCADNAAASDPLAGTFVDTAFDARFCASNVHRLLVVNVAKVLAAAAAVPDWDEVVVLVNDTTFGGSGGAVPVVSTNASSTSVVQHEYGHSFTGLADEYDLAFPGFPSCSDLGNGFPCEVNVTDETNPGLIKWAPWIDGGTPIPTPEGGGFGAVVGLFEGARYLTTGMYRPRDTDCLMRALAEPFCEVCAQEYVLKLYRGGWGVPIHGIDLIEPGSESPAPGVIDASEPITLSVDLLAPIGGPPLDTSWWVDGSLQPGATGPSFFVAPPSSGEYHIEIRVEDVTSFVHPAMAGAALRSSRSWTVNASVDSPPVFSFDHPNQLQLEVLTPSAALATWNDRSDGEAAFEIIARGPTGGWRKVADAGVGFERAVVKRLEPGTRYDLRVRARNGFLISRWSAKRRLDLPGLLARPDQLTAAVLSSTTVRLTWRDRSTGEDTFEVHRRAVPGIWEEAAVVGAGVERVDLTGLAPQTTYVFRVRARGDGTMSQWRKARVETMP